MISYKRVNPAWNFQAGFIIPRLSSTIPLIIVLLRFAPAFTSCCFDSVC